MCFDKTGAHSTACAQHSIVLLRTGTLTADCMELLGLRAADSGSFVPLQRGEFIHLMLLLVLNTHAHVQRTTSRCRSLCARQWRAATRSLI